MIADTEERVKPTPKAGNEPDLVDELGRHWSDMQRSAAWYIQATRDAAAAKVRSLLIKVVGAMLLAIAAGTILVCGLVMLIRGCAQLVEHHWHWSAGAACAGVGAALLLVCGAAGMTAFGIARRRHMKALVAKYGNSKVQNHG
jgi:hypothetical protein